jgi:histidinol phosphatase-like PHP family hydrolase
MTGTTAAPPAFDLHVHAGIERGAHTLEDFLAALARRGVTRVGLVDHAECYYDSSFYPGFGAHLDGLRQTAPWPYARDAGGLRAFYRDAADIRAGGRFEIALGLEIGDCDRAPEALLDLPDYFLNCSSMLGLEAESTHAGRLLSRMQRFHRLVAGRGKPAIVAHPFRELYHACARRAADAAPPAPRKLLAEEDVRLIVDAAAGMGLFLEWNEGCLACFPGQGPVAELATHIAGCLEAEKARLSYGSDSHHPPAPVRPAASIRAMRDGGLSRVRFRAAEEALFGKRGNGAR